MQRLTRLVPFFFVLAAPGCGSNDQPQDSGVLDAQLPPPRPLTFDELVEACVRVSACDVARRTRLRDCIENYTDREIRYGWRQLADRAYQCANQAGSDCKLIRECFGFPGKPKTCDLETFQPRCDGEVAVICDKNHQNGKESWEQLLDCARGGLKCAIVQTGVGQKSAACGGGPCDQTRDRPRCQDRRKLTCRAGGWEINDCPEQGLQCRDPAVELCEGTGRSCPPSTDVCKGNLLSACVNGYLYEVDCTKLVGRKVCDQAQKKCVAGGKECVVTDFIDLCEGDILVSCVDGYKRRTDCKQMGFLNCSPIQPYGAYCRGAEVYE